MFFNLVSDAGPSLGLGPTQEESLDALSVEDNGTSGRRKQFGKSDREVYSWALLEKHISGDYFNDQLASELYWNNVYILACCALQTENKEPRILELRNQYKKIRTTYHRRNLNYLEAKTSIA
ncbi:hypothetical protein QJS10_CPB13g01412 [Acorus calamus]|uniref:Uncharacterized protein n=1 Tax=Acorus calamus TaxID=4465 RepID=A0AAV9DIV8_ACOCL|nr:hypothetical protein QJS10_CPB13g01412 [Acorus calamus]